MSRDDDYDVGYGKPPKQTRFEKGRSGNPKGRLKGVKTLAVALKEALAERVTVTENGRRRKITKLEAITTQLVNKAATADLTATRLLLGMVQLVETQADPSATTAMNVGEDDEKVMRQLYARIRSMNNGGEHA